MSPGVPLVGVTPDIEWAGAGVPPRAFYQLDSTNFDALREAGAAAVMLPHDAAFIGRYLEVVDALLVSGGGWQFPHADLVGEGADGADTPHKLRRLAFERALIEAALARDLPLLCVCGGFQVLNAVLGGKLIVSLAESRPGPIEHRQPQSYAEGTHVVRAVPGSLLARWIGTEDALVNSKHRQGVIDVGSGARVAATAPDGLVEAIEVQDRRFAVGVQWHPEFHVCSADESLFRAFVSAARGHAAGR